MPAAATVRQKPKPTVPSVATATGPTSAACVSVTRAAWARDVSARLGTTVRLMTSTASRSQAAQSAAGEATVCADSAPAIQRSSARSGANTASVTTSTACASKESCVPVSTRTSLCQDSQNERLVMQTKKANGQDNGLIPVVLTPSEFPFPLLFPARRPQMVDSSHCKHTLVGLHSSLILSLTNQESTVSSATIVQLLWQSLLSSEGGVNKWAAEYKQWRSGMSSPPSGLST